VRHVVTHAGVVKGHKRRVEYDAERYEEIDKRVHDEQLDDASEALPAGAALPVKQELLYTEFQHLFGAHLMSEPSADETFNIINLTVKRRRSSNYSTPAYVHCIISQPAHKCLVNVYVTFTIAFTVYNRFRVSIYRTFSFS